MNFKPQCKTVAEMLRMAADTVEMFEGSGLKPVYQWRGDRHVLAGISISDVPEECEFPVALIEGKSVWRGDEVFYEGKKFTVTGKGAGCLWLQGDMISGTANPKECSWIPPRRTVTINSVEVVAPTAVEYSDDAERPERYGLFLSFEKREYCNAFKTTLEKTK